jgi:hypothetical protein
MIHHPSLFSFQPDSNQPENMKYFILPLNLIGALAVLAMAVGCATTEPGPLSSAATQEESLLTSAGFRIKVATTPQQQQHLKTLTPDKMTTVHRNGKTYYVYADPTKMQIYVGTQAENKRYQQLRKANNLAEEKSYSEAMGDWGSWEPFGY